MPKLSEKAVLMPASPIRKLTPFAEKAKAEGVKIYHLNIGQPDIETPAVALKAIKEFDETIIAYSHSAGVESYRRGVAQYYKKIGVDIDYSDILATTGGSEALIFAMMTCLNPGEEIITPEPFYANYNGFAVEAGVSIVPVKSSIENDFALPPIADMESKITSKTKAILICNPNNPTGYLYSKEELESVADIVKRHNLFLICDEVYREFCYDGAQHFSTLNLKGIEDNVVVVDSVSKRYSMCGVRLGTLISRNKEVISSALKLGQARLCPPHLAQIAAEAALNTPESYFQNVVTEYKKRRDFLVEAMNKIDGVYCPKPQGAFYTVASLPVDDAEKFSQWLLEEFRYNNQTVMLAPAAGFYATPSLGTNEVRIAYVLNCDDLAAAVACLDKALRVYPGRR